MNTNNVSGQTLQIRDTMVLTAGPDISDKEVSYVMDAVKTGWNSHWSDYIRKFEKRLAEYLGVRHVLAVDHGTSALHLAMTLFNVGPGDEVIVPDMTYIACSNVVIYTGARPVFADVDPVTWCLDPASVEKNITPKTKAIMPVWMYGNVPDMGGIIAIAKKHNLLVVEDSCPALCAAWNGRKAGTIGDVGAFSFQGAKIAVMGEGGAMVTNKTEYYERAKSLFDHGADHTRQFWAKQIGFMYEISNLQCALGLGQVERVEEFVEKKRRIFSWYKARLADIPYLAMNQELPGAKSNMWMSSVIVGEKSPVNRDNLRAELKKRMIDTRPFFFPITMFPMYEDKAAADRNPHSYYVGARGINLPSGLALTEDDIEYVCEHIRDILSV